MQRVYWLLGALGVAGVLYALSRTQRGGEIASEIVGGTLDALTPRGIRNNNPGNIRHVKNTTWQGQSPTQTDDAFVQFLEPKWGIRAMARILKNYFLNGTNTVQKVISRWAPATENNTNAYVAAVAKEINKPATATLTYDDLPALITAIIRHENGKQPYTAETIKEGISLA
jgi:hypothetical protein